MFAKKFPLKKKKVSDAGWAVCKNLYSFRAANGRQAAFLRLGGLGLAERSEALSSARPAAEPTSAEACLTASMEANGDKSEAAARRTDVLDNGFANGALLATGEGAGARGTTNACKEASGNNNAVVSAATGAGREQQAQHIACTSPGTSVAQKNVKNKDETQSNQVCAERESHSR